MLGFLIAIMILLSHSNVSCSPEEGSYEAIVSSISSCVAVQPHWYHAHVSVYNISGRNLLQGNIVTKQDFKDPRFHIRVNYVDHGVEKKVFEIKNQNCRNFIFIVVMQAIGLERADPWKCILKPTTVEFSNVDLNAILHTVVHSLWYGSLQIHFEITKSTTLLLCLDINVQIKKIEN